MDYNASLLSDEGFKSVMTEELKLTENEFENLSSHIHSVSYKKGDVIYRQDTPSDYLGYIKSGLVKTFIRKKDREFIYDIKPAGAFLGMMSVFSRREMRYSTGAIQETEIYHIRSGPLWEIVQVNPEFAQYLITYLSGRGLSFYQRHIDILTKQLPGKIADVLLFFSRSVFHSDTFIFPLSRKELAGLTGTRKESVIRTLNEFKHDKIIELQGKKVTILSFDIIEKLSEFG
jgi:CRP-like cAMP-binding protein